jgi:hypothetical protein
MDYLDNLQCTPLDISIKHEIMVHFSELFYTNLSILAAGLLLALGGIFYHSKCLRVKILWGCIDLTRDIEHEIENDQNPDIEMPTMSLPHDLSGEDRH